MEEDLHRKQALDVNTTPENTDIRGTSKIVATLGAHTAPGIGMNRWHDQKKHLVGTQWSSSISSVEYRRSLVPAPPIPMHSSIPARARLLIDQQVPFHEDLEIPCICTMVLYVRIAKLCELGPTTSDCVGHSQSRLI